MRLVYVNCKFCKGTGKILDKTCNDCKGEGQIPVEVSEVQRETTEELMAKYAKEKESN